MLTRKRRVLVGAGSSVIWPAITVLMPMGITFAAARVYAEAAPAPEACDAGVVIECADAAVGTPCKSCTGGTCACFSASCKNGDTLSDKGNTCRDMTACNSVVVFPCAGGFEPNGCMTMTGPGTCVDLRIDCLPDDGGPVIQGRFQACVPKEAGASSSSSSGDNGGSTSGVFIPGPDKVPGSSGAANTPASSDDDSGCSTSSSRTMPLLAVPAAIGLLLALRRRQPKKAPSARKRS